MAIAGLKGSCTLKEGPILPHQEQIHADKLGVTHSTVQRLHHRQTRSHGAEGWQDASEDNKQMIVQCANFSRSLNPRNIDKSVSDIRIRVRFPFESSFWITVPVANWLSWRICNRQTGWWSSLQSVHLFHWKNPDCKVWKEPILSGIDADPDYKIRESWRFS